MMLNDSTFVWTANSNRIQHKTIKKKKLENKTKNLGKLKHRRYSIICQAKLNIEKMFCNAILHTTENLILPNASR